MLPRCGMGDGLIKVVYLADAPSVDARAMRKCNGVPTVAQRWIWRYDMTREEAIKFLEETSFGGEMLGDKNLVAVCDLAISALREQEERRWIPVTERLPDWRDGKVLVFTEYGFSICERTVNNRWRGQHANWITHWTYLPKPPKGE